MPFIVPLGILLNKMRTIHTSTSCKSKNFLKCFYYTRISCYATFTPIVHLLC